MSRQLGPQRAHSRRPLRTARAAAQCDPDRGVRRSAVPRRDARCPVTGHESGSLRRLREWPSIEICSPPSERRFPGGTGQSSSAAASVLPGADLVKKGEELPITADARSMSACGRKQSFVFHTFGNHGVDAFHSHAAGGSAPACGGKSKRRLISVRSADADAPQSARSGACPECATPNARGWERSQAAQPCGERGAVLARHAAIEARAVHRRDERLAVASDPLCQSGV